MAIRVGSCFVQNDMCICPTVTEAVNGSSSDTVGWPFLECDRDLLKVSRQQLDSLILSTLRFQRPIGIRLFGLSKLMFGGIRPFSRQRTAFITPARPLAPSR